MGGKGIYTKSIQDIVWLKLDNAAKLFPAIMSDELTVVFRITASLKEPVRFSAIKEAVEITFRRFPYFSVSLGSGLFWYYLEYNHKLPRIQSEEKIPCTAFAAKRKNEPLYRILVKENRISVEFIHILTDGGGAFEYLKTLLHTYFRLNGKTIISTEGIILPESPIADSEMEELIDSFEVVPTPPNTRVKLSCAMVSFRNKLRLDFCNISKSKTLEMHFLLYPDSALFRRYLLTGIFLIKLIFIGPH